MDTQIKGWNMHKVIAHALVLLMLWLGGAAYAGTVTYVYTDAQGTPLAEADANGNITARFDYTPYGVSVPSMGPAPNGPGYTGHVNDPDTGLVYMQARYYDPAVGRFLSVDPVSPAPGNLFNFNRYDYTSNNPLNHTDPDGRCSDADGSCSRMVAAQGAYAAAHPNEPLSPIAKAGLGAMLTASGVRAAVEVVEGALILDKVLSDSPALIYGKAQVTRAGGKETMHASTSERIAGEQAMRADAKSVHLNQRISTVTHGEVRSSLRPDVATVRTDGKVDVHEVLSPRQESGATAAKYNDALGGRAGIVKCYPPDKC